MADISKITLPNGSSYNFKDATARSDLSNKLGVNDKAASAKTADSVAWANTGHPATFPPSAHNHDDRYYTESEIEAKRYTTAKMISGTVDDLYKGRYDTTGGVGSISLTKKSSGIGSEISAGWYNYIYSPHRDGIGYDNNKYATVILCPMNFSGTSYIIRYSSGAIAEVKPIITSHQSLSNYVQTSDSRLSNARPASDVKDWAKKNTLSDAINASLTTGFSTPVDNDYYISQYVNGGTTTTTYHRRPMSALWEYIKGKISSVLGLTNTTYSGKANTAGTADNANKVNGHTVGIDVPANAKFTDTKYDAISNDWIDKNLT